MGFSYENSYYKVVSGPTWRQAQANAESIGGNLVSINSKKEENFLHSKFSNFSKFAVQPHGDAPETFSHWIGLNDVASEGNWKWSDGSDFSYKSPLWGIQEGTYRRDENYARITWNVPSGWTRGITTKGFWQDYDNDAWHGSTRGTPTGIAEIPLSYFSISDTEVEEGEKGKIKITRSGGTSTEQTLILATSDGSAVAGDDYKKKTKTITFAAGETSKTVNIVTNEDIDVESDETIKLTLSASSGDTVPAQIQNGSATLTIKNDEFKRENSLYTLVDGSTWTEAQTNAKALGGNLVTINSEQENNWLVRKFNITGMHDDRTKLNDYSAIAYWIGFTDKDNEGQWKWISGETSDYSKWHDDRHLGGQLSPNGGSRENYAYLGGYTDKSWDDQPNIFSHRAFTVRGIAEIPLGPTYSITPTVSSSNEGGEVRTNVTTTGVDAGTRLYWTLSGVGIDADDFSTGDLKGSRVVQSDGTITFAHTLANDLTTEGTETLEIKLFSDWARTTQVGDTASVTINDTSLTPAPTYSITPSLSSTSEGARFTTSVSTTRVAPGTKLYWSLSGTGIDVNDFSSGSLSGSRVVKSDGTINFAHTLANDLTTEGTEKIGIKLFSDSARTTQVGETAFVSVADTSLSPPEKAVFTVDGTNVWEGDTAQVLITRKGNTSAAIDLTVNTVNGTAKSGSDYTQIKDKTIRFGAGVKSKKLSIATKEDTAVESDETFKVKIASTDDLAQFNTKAATVTIEDDDQAVVNNTTNKTNITYNYFNSNNTTVGSNNTTTTINSNNKNNIVNSNNKLSSWNIYRVDQTVKARDIVGQWFSDSTPISALSQDVN